RLRVTALREVLDNEHEAAVPPFPVVNGREHGAGPEVRAVAARTPPLVRAAPGLAAGDKVAPRLVRRNRLRRIEAREMPADDLRGSIARDAFGARVPACHEALRVEHDDGVILDPFDEQAE